MDAMGNSKRPWVILNMAIRPPRVRRCVRENRRSCLRAASYGTCRSPFTNFRASFCTFSSAPASQNRMWWLQDVFKMWLDKRFVQGGGWNIRGKGREGWFQVKQHPTGFIGSADDIEPAVPRFLVVETVGIGLDAGWVMVREVVSDEMGGVTNGEVLAFGGVEVQLPIPGPAGADV